MNPLSSEERDTFANQLSYSARVGGWFFIGMGVFMATLFTLPLFGILNSNEITYEAELIGPLIALLSALFLPGIWLLRRRRKIRTQLDEDLLTSTADIVTVSGPDPYTGYTTTVRVNTPSGNQRESKLQSYAQPTWQSGERIQVLLTADETIFFPRDTDINMNMGRLYTPRQTKTRNFWRYLFMAIISALMLFGFYVGFTGQ